MSPVEAPQAPVRSRTEETPSGPPEPHHGRSLASRAASRVLSVAFWAFVALTSAAAFSISAVLWVLGTPVDPQRRLNHLFASAWAWLYALAVPQWHVKVTGRERIARNRPHVICANHTSMADIVLCFGLFRQFKWVSKKVNFSIPFIGWNMRLCRYVPLVRGNPASIRVMMDRCRWWLRRGMSIMMFPEGTRSRTGRPQRFKEGSFILAIEEGVPVVPVAIHGAHALIPKHAKTFAPRADVRVEVLEPIPPDDFEDPAVYGEAVRERILEALEARGSLPPHSVS